MLSKNNEILVRFEEVQKSYDGETLVVKNLNPDIAKGEFVTILGPSGSGRTTCLMMLAGFETATHGKIILDSKSNNNVPPHKRDIGMVFQNYALFPHMTVAENPAYPLNVREMCREDVTKPVERALDMVQLGSLAT
jgi:putative spermidine/putrescine transport system ATP-binding protein